MKSAVKFIFFTLLVLHAAQSYVLLTANLDDLGVLLKQVSQSPVMEQVRRLVSRASEQFQRQARATDSGEPLNIVVLTPGLNGERENDVALEQLGRRASGYLKAFQRFVEKNEI